jgi:hypothetical protein
MTQVITEYTNAYGQTYGIYQERDGSYLALTPVHARNYKTIKGAVKWMRKCGTSASMAVAGM